MLRTEGERGTCKIRSSQDNVCCVSGVRRADIASRTKHKLNAYQHTQTRLRGRKYSACNIRHQVKVMVLSSHIPVHTRHGLPRQGNRQPLFQRRSREARLSNTPTQLSTSLHHAFQTTAGGAKNNLNQYELLTAYCRALMQLYTFRHNPSHHKKTRRLEKSTSNGRRHPDAAPLASPSNPLDIVAKEKEE